MGMEGVYSNTADNQEILSKASSSASTASMSRQTSSASSASSSKPTTSSSSRLSSSRPAPAKTPGKQVAPDTIQGGEDKDEVTRHRRDHVKGMMRHAWDNYVTYAWGQNELRPVSKRGHSGSVFGSSPMGATVVDSLDTLYIMGLDEEFERAKQWVVDNLNMSHLNGEVSVFETNIRYVGGLLTAYAFTGEEIFKQ